MKEPLPPSVIRVGGSAQLGSPGENRIERKDGMGRRKEGVGIRNVRRMKG